MTTSLVLVPCKLCKTRIPVSDLRKNKDGLYVCNTCLSHGFYETSLRTTELRKPLPSKVQPQTKKEEKISYLCNSCKFSFTKPFESEDKNCPMCGKDFNVVRKQSASELLRDVESMFGE
ncbi:MAG: hypothetical protein AABX45_00375 [Nanoarchaeota archaeon]